MSSRALRTLALGLWWVSLLLPGIVTWGGGFPGLYILLIGWLALPESIAWFANIFLIPAFRTVRKPSAPKVAWIVLAAIASLDMFRMSVAQMDEGGGTSGVYGYGPGALLWLCSIFALWIATGQKMVEWAIADEADARPGRIFRTVGVVALASLLAATLAKGVLDRVTGNVDEREMLELTSWDHGLPLVRRGPVCTMAHFEATPLQYPPGSIDMTEAPRIDYLDSPLDLFAHGATAVRIGNIDFHAHTQSGRSAFSANRASGPPAVRVSLLSGAGKSNRTWSLRLEVPSTAQQVTYLRERRGVENGSIEETCPRSEYPDYLDSKLLLNTLTLDTSPNMDIDYVIRDTLALEKASARLVVAERLDEPVLVPLNADCPPQIVLDYALESLGATKREAEAARSLGTPVSIADTIHFMPWPGRDAKLFCAAESAYLLGWTSTEAAGELDKDNKAERELTVRKFRAGDASTEWVVRAQLSPWIRSDHVGRSPRTIMATGISEQPSGIVVALTVIWDGDVEPGEEFPNALLLNLH